MNLKRLPILLTATFFLIAGLNHFIHPAFYLPLIPDYLLYPEIINAFSGSVEILLSFGLIFKQTRKYTCIGLIVMLIAFIPSHIYFISIGSCIENGLCIPSWAAWLRLLIIQPALIFWIYRLKNQ